MDRHPGGSREDFSQPGSLSSLSEGLLGWYSQPVKLLWFYCQNLSWDHKHWHTNDLKIRQKCEPKEEEKTQSPNPIHLVHSEAFAVEWREHSNTFLRHGTGLLHYRERWKNGKKDGKTKRTKDSIPCLLEDSGFFFKKKGNCTFDIRMAVLTQDAEGL